MRRRRGPGQGVIRKLLDRLAKEDATVGVEHGLLNETSLDSALAAASQRAWYEQARVRESPTS